MNATALCSLLAIAMSAAAAPAGAQLPPSSMAPLHPLSECLGPSRARSWHQVDSTSVLVDAGRKRFLLELAMACPEIGVANSVAFVPAGGAGRICGGLRDSIVPTGRNRGIAPCRIATVTPLTRAQFDAALVGKRATGVISVTAPADADRP